MTITSDGRTYHGLSKTKLYGVWKNMKKRCYDKNSKSYKSYGLKGVTVSEEWVNDFLAFRDWSISNGYSEELNLHLDKDILCEKLGIHPKIYSKDTCMFISQYENNSISSSRNSSHSMVKISEDEASELCEAYYNSNLTHKDIAEYHNVSRSCISQIIRSCNV